MLYILPFLICALYMTGGQLNKAFRRFGIPTLTIAATLWRVFTNKKREDKTVSWSALAWLVAISILSVGYGIESFLYKFCERLFPE